MVFTTRLSGAKGDMDAVNICPQSNSKPIEKLTNDIPIPNLPVFLANCATHTKKYLRCG